MIQKLHVMHASRVSQVPHIIYIYYPCPLGLKAFLTHPQLIRSVQHQQLDGCTLCRLLNVCEPYLNTTK